MFKIKISSQIHNCGIFKSRKSKLHYCNLIANYLNITNNKSILNISNINFSLIQNKFYCLSSIAKYLKAINNNFILNLCNLTPLSLH